MDTRIYELLEDLRSEMARSFIATHQSLEGLRMDVRQLRDATNERLHEFEEHLEELRQEMEPVRTSIRVVRFFISGWRLGILTLSSLAAAAGLMIERFLS